MTCSLGDFEVCGNGAAEISTTSTQPVEQSSSQVNQSEAGTNPEQSPSDTEEGSGRHDDTCSTDDDQFSDVGEAPDTEVTIPGTNVTICLYPPQHSLAVRGFALTESLTCSLQVTPVQPKEMHKAGHSCALPTFFAFPYFLCQELM